MGSIHEFSSVKNPPNSSENFDKFNNSAAPLSDGYGERLSEVSQENQDFGNTGSETTVSELSQPTLLQQSEIIIQDFENTDRTLSADYSQQLFDDSQQFLSGDDHTIDGWLNFTFWLGYKRLDLDLPGFMLLRSIAFNPGHQK